MFRILSIDGGGFRGVYAAHILMRIEEEFNVSWTKDFDMIAGTSTGSIIAAGLVSGMTAGNIYSLYEKIGKSIFQRKFFCRLGLFASMYSASNLKTALDEVFGDKKLGDFAFPLIIPATDIGNGYVHVFKSQYVGTFVRDKGVKMADAVLASCSAPTYFDPYPVGTFLLADGGLWANSPSLVAAIDAKKRFNKSFDELRILTIGTGISRQYYPQKCSFWNRLLGWGFVTRWKRASLIDMILNLQSESANNMLGLLLSPEQILRIDYSSDVKEPMDDPKLLRDITGKAERYFTHNSERIKSFLRKEQ